MSRINFRLSSAEHGKGFYNLGTSWDELALDVGCCVMVTRLFAFFFSGSFAVISFLLAPFYF